jgi:hypothetical protein
VLTSMATSSLSLSFLSFSLEGVDCVAGAGVSPLALAIETLLFRGGMMRSYVYRAVQGRLCIKSYITAFALFRVLDWAETRRGCPARLPDRLPLWRQRSDYDIMMSVWKPVTVEVGGTQQSEIKYWVRFLHI